MTGAPRVAMPQQPPSTAAWPYRCYVIKPFKTGWKAICGLEFTAYDFPRSFAWTDRADREGLRTYIDLITAGRKSEAMAIQERGLVKDLEYDPEQLTGSIRINFERFIDLLAHRGHLDIPLKEKLVFVGAHGRQLVPAEFITVLSRYVDNPEWFGNPADWHWVSRAEMDELDPMAVSSSMYRGLPNMQDTPGEAAHQGALPLLPTRTATRVRRAVRPPREAEVHRRSFEKHFELVTVAQPDHGRPYFIRRLARFDGHLLWSGTSYQASGPWTEYSRDDAQLLAMGVHG